MKHVSAYSEAITNLSRSYMFFISDKVDMLLTPVHSDAGVVGGGGGFGSFLIPQK